MCTAYELGKGRGSSPGYVPARAVSDLLGLLKPRIVRPTHIAPVVMADRSLREMSWGFRRSVPPKKKGAVPPMRTIVNSREDKLGGRTWNAAFRQRRCLVPAAAFFEWIEVARGRKVPLRFERTDGGLIWIAGIWEEGVAGSSFSMITTEPNSVLEPVHDRMPALLTDEQIPAYLAGELNEFGPSSVSLIFAEAENFLKRKKEPPPPPAQGELLL